MTRFHPWLSTPEALEAARKAVKIPMALMGSKVAIIGEDELTGKALEILTECAMPPRERLHTTCANCQKALDGIRAGARFCSRQCRNTYAKSVGRGVPAPSKAVHIGSMWSWPDDDMMRYAVRTVGYCLNNYLRTQVYARPESA